MSMQTLLRRVEALEARIKDVETGHTQTIYKLERRLVRVDLMLTALVPRLVSDFVEPTDEEIDAVLDER